MSRAKHESTHQGRRPISVTTVCHTSSLVRVAATSSTTSALVRRPGSHCGRPSDCSDSRCRAPICGTAAATFAWGRSMAGSRLSR
jgi:hypothetical protein